MYAQFKTGLKKTVYRAIALMVETAKTSETSINFYETTRCNTPEDSHLHTHRRENLKSLQNAVSSKL
jgi:hypothetical protein